MNKKYTINFDKFFDLITKKTHSEKNNESTITEIWQPEQGEMKVVNKEIVENKVDVNAHLCSVRYDFLNGLINQVLSVYQTPSGTIFKNSNQFSFGQKIIFDTFMKEGVFVEENCKSE